ncbi:MAG: DUF4258 domain-containing protein [Gemmatimonadaceae bacterium]
MPDPTVEPLKPPEAKQLVREIIENGIFDFSGHAQEEMAKDDLEAADCLNVLRGGVYQPAEPEGMEWRYRVSTTRIVVVFAFVSAIRLRVITAWRSK